MKEYKKKIIVILFLFILPLPIVYKVILNPGHLSYSDYVSSYGEDRNISKNFYVWNEDLGGYPGITTNLFAIPIISVQILLNKIINPLLVDVLILYLSLVFYAAGSLCVLSLFLKRKITTLIGTGWLIYTPFTLSAITYGWPLIGFFPLGCSFFIVYYGIKYCRHGLYKDLIIALLFSLGAFLTIQYGSLGLGLLFILIIFELNIQKVKRFFILSILTIIINLWWILPFIILSAFYNFHHYNIDVKESFDLLVSNSSYLKTFILRNFEAGGYSSFTNFQGSITSYTFGILPIFAWVVSNFIIKNNLIKIKLNLLAVIFLTLSLGGLSVVYSFLFFKIPFFYMFRDVSKFSPYFMLCVISMILISIELLFKRKVLSYSLIIVITIFQIISSYPLASGNLNGLLSPVELPKYYYDFVNYQKNNTEVGSDLILPMPNWFSFFDWHQNGKGYQIQNPLKTMAANPVIYDEFSEINLKQPHKDLINELSYLDNKDILKSLSKLNIRSIILQHDQIGGLSKGFTNFDSDLFLRYMSSAVSGNLNFKQFGNIDLITFSTINTKRVEGNNLSFKRISPVEYKIIINNLEDNEITLNQFYSKGWKLSIRNNKHYFKNEIMDTIYQTLFSPEIKRSNDEVSPYENKWIISANSITKNQDNYYVKNGDDTLSANLLLYYQPQLFLYIGFAISAVFIIIALLILLIKTSIHLKYFSSR